MGGNYEFVEKLWAKFVLTPGRVNTEKAWTRDEVLVGSVIFLCHFVSFYMYIVVVPLVNHFNRKTASNSVTPDWLRYCSPIAQFAIHGAWCDIAGLHTNVGEGQFLSGCRDRLRPFLQRCHA